MATRKRAKKSEKKAKEKIIADKKENYGGKELYWVFGVMIAIIVIIFAVYMLIQSQKNFEYKGLTFTKENFGEIPVYHYYYLFENKADGGTIKYNLYLRKDPRALEIPVDEGIVYPEGKFVYLSINSTNLNQCEESQIAVSSLSSFITNNQITAKGATPNEEEAKEKNLRYADCGTHPDNLVVILTDGEETKIVRNKDLCFTIYVSNCEIVEAVEAFEIQSIVDAKKNN